MEGYVNSYPDEYRKLDQGNILMRRNTEDRVSVIIGAGGGNEPWPIGYVGKGLADACALGNVLIPQLDGLGCRKSELYLLYGTVAMVMFFFQPFILLLSEPFYP